MKLHAAAFAALILAGCASTPTSKQAEWDKACKYANGVVSVSRPYVPLATQLIQAKFGEDASLAFQAAYKTVEFACSDPLNVSDSVAVIQRIYDAGGQIVALVIKAQSQVE